MQPYQAIDIRLISHPIWRSPISLAAMVFLLCLTACLGSGSANHSVTRLSQEGIHFSDGSLKSFNLKQENALTLVLYCYESNSLTLERCTFFDQLDASIFDWAYLPSRSDTSNCANTWARRQELVTYTYDLLEPGNFMDTLFVNENGKMGLLVLDEYDRKSLLHQIEPMASDLDNHALIILQWNPEIGMQVMRFNP
jgi:hypothetical protein